MLKSPLMLIKRSQWFPILVRVSEAPCITSIVFVEFPYPLFNLHIYYNIFFLKNQICFFCVPNSGYLVWKPPTTLPVFQQFRRKKTRPTYYGALPAELNPYVAGAEGLEPPTSGLAGKNNCCSGLYLFGNII